MTVETVTTGSHPLNEINLSRLDYKGLPSTLCPGCGHTSISNQIITACYELNIMPEELVKFSGIGCSSKSPSYFMARSYGFNSLHGRMPSLALGALFADKTIRGIGISGDGDTASIGLGQFKHLVRRNLPLVYIIENNGVYGLTKGQFSATAERGLELKKQGRNPYLPVDVCMEALIANASFVARSFAGDPKQVLELIKAAFMHNGTAVIDIISPCVTFHNQDSQLHSYVYGKTHEKALHDVSYIPPKTEIVIDDFMEGTIRGITLHDGSRVLLKKLADDYDPTNRWHALRMLEEAEEKQLLVTGLLYVNPEYPSMFENFDMVDEPLNRLGEEQLRPSKETMRMVNDLMF